MTSTGDDTSDHETTTPWLDLPNTPRRTPVMSWIFFTTGTDSYDVAWFKVEYVVYRVPD